MIRILAGCAVNQDADVFKAHVQTLQWQTGGYQTDLAFVIDTSMDGKRGFEVESYAREVGRTLVSDPKPDDAKYAVHSVTHDWSKSTFHWLGAQKQKLIELAKEGKYDALWLVDSDLLCSPDTLDSLWKAEKPVTSAVFWTKWTPGSPPLPQVWLSHPYELQGRGIEAHEFLGLLAQRQLVRVTGLGACTLIRADVLDRVGFQQVEGLPQGGMWQGEDRHFCITAARNQVELWADAWADVWHCYRPEDRALLGEWAERLGREFPFTKLYEGPSHTGDLVSFIIEPLEEPHLAGYKAHVRGRIGAIKMLPQIEREVQEMRAGEQRIVRVRFPLWWQIPEYRGQEKLVRISLLHCKPFWEHPTLGDSPVAAVQISEHFMEAA